MPKSITQVNYDDLRLISKTLDSEGESFVQLHSITRQKVNALRNDWDGDAAKSFFNEADGTLLPAIQRVSMALLEAQSVLDQITKIIYDADAETVSYFNEFAAVMDGAPTNKGVSLLTALGLTLSNLHNADKHFLKIMTDFISDRMDFKNTLKALGLSNAYGIFKDGIPYAGDLNKLLRGFSDDLKIQIRGFKLDGFDFAGIGLGIFEDINKPNYDGNLGRTAGINGLNGLIEIVISRNPYVGGALLINSGVQILGNLGIAAEKAMYSVMAPDDLSRQILLEQSELKSKALEKMDLGHITKSFSTSIIDGFLFTDEGRKGLMDTLKSTVNVLDGASELIIDNNVFTPATKGILYMDRAIQALPLSDSMKQASSIVLHQNLQAGKDLMEGFANWIDWR